MLNHEYCKLMEAYSSVVRNNDDYRYAKAVENGDFISTDIMLRREFMRKFPNTKATYGRGPRRLFHGSRSGKLFTVFKPEYGFNINAIFFSSSPSVASHWSSSGPHSFNSRLLGGIDKLKTKEDIETFAKRVLKYHDFTIELTNDDGTPRDVPGVSSDRGWSPAITRNGPEDPLEMAKDILRSDAMEAIRKESDTSYGYARNFTFECYLNVENPVIINARGHKWYDIPYDGKDGNTIEEVFVNMDESNDGLIIYNVLETDYANAKTDDYIIRRANQIKSCDVTFDDEDNLIPLSKRYDSSNDDIRY